MSSFVKLVSAMAILCALLIMPVEVEAISTHPCLLTNQAGVELAKRRIQEEDWAKSIRQNLEKQAQDLEKEKLPVFEKDWWKESSKKHWSQTYPEINYHTNFAIVGPIIKALDTSVLYALTGDQKYAELVKKVLLHYTQYEFFAEHPDVGLNWSIVFLRAMFAYDFIYDTLSDSDHAKIDDLFKRAMEAVKKDDQWWIKNNPGGLFNNHFAWHKHFIGTYGLFYNKPELADYALNEDHGIRELIEHGTKDDGLWLEGSLNYHFTALIALAEHAIVCRNAGSSMDLWTHRFANGRNLSDLFMGPIQTLFPDETLPTIGDTYGKRMRLDSVNWYYPAYNAYPWPEMAWVLRNRKDKPFEALFMEHQPLGSPPAPSMKTRIWPEHGYIALRSQEGMNYWRGEGYSVFLSFDSNGIHSHNDKFDLMAYARGAHIAVDPEATASAQHAFSSQIQNELNHYTICHNTVMVDRQNQTFISKKLELVDFVNGNDVKLATIADTQGMVYPGVRMMRTVAVTSDYILDVFQVASDEEHTYDYLFHSYDDGGYFNPLPGDFQPAGLGSDVPWKWLKNVKEMAWDHDFQVTARQGELTARLKVLGQVGTTMILCEFPKNDTFEKPSVPMLMVRRHAKSTVFVTLLQAERGNLPISNISIGEDRHGFLRAKVESGYDTKEFTFKKLE